MAGSGAGNVSTLLSVEGGIDVDWEGLEWSMVDGPFAFKGRWRMVAFDPLACQSSEGRLESSDVLPPASARSESARVGWLDVLNKREKGMPKGVWVLYGRQPLKWQTHRP
jgi:hypothetical protein